MYWSNISNISWHVFLTCFWEKLALNQCENVFCVCLCVCRLDPGGLAEQGGVKMGDQILSANGVSFENINHYTAVEVLKSRPHAILTIKVSQTHTHTYPLSLTYLHTHSLKLTNTHTYSLSLRY